MLTSSPSHFSITARRTITDPTERARRLGQALSYVLSLADAEKKTANDADILAGSASSAAGTAQTFRPEHQDYITEAVA